MGFVDCGEEARGVVRAVGVGADGLAWLLGGLCWCGGGREIFLLEGFV